MHDGEDELQADQAIEDIDDLLAEDVSAGEDGERGQDAQGEQKIKRPNECFRPPRHCVWRLVDHLGQAAACSG